MQVGINMWEWDLQQIFYINLYFGLRSFLKNPQNPQKKKNA